MKKIYLSLFALALASISFAQSNAAVSRRLVTEIEEPHSNSDIEKAGGDLVWSSNFTTAADWTIDNDGQTMPGFGWAITTSSNSWALNNINSTSDGAFADLNNGDPTLAVPNQALDVVYTMTNTTPIDITASASNGLIIDFLQYGARFNDAQEIYISTDGTNFTLVGSNADIDVYSQTGGAPYTNPTLKAINISSLVAGETQLWIRFQWTTAFPGSASNPNVWVTYGWMIDDVRVTEAFPDDFKVSKVFSHDVVNAWNYAQTPNEQTASTVVGVWVSNEGGSVQTKTINLDILLSAASVYSGATTAVTLNPGESDTVWFDTGFTPSALGVYTINASIAADGVLTNNTASETFEITDFIFGHNFALGTGKISFTDEEEIGIGNQYQMQADQLLKGIDVNFATVTNAGMFLDVYVFEIVAGSIQDVNNIDVVNFSYQIPTPVSTSAVTSILLPTPYTLEAGKTYLAILKGFQSSTEKFAIKSSAKGDEDFSTVCFGPFGASNAVNYFSGWGSAPAVKLNFNPVLEINEANSDVSISEIYPNPSSAETFISYSVENTNTISINLVDVTGKVVKSWATATQNAGEHTVSFNAAELNAGVYFVNIATENSVVTKKFIKK
ncbi:MAG: T9SS type A sorting domain-containing protein [Bacteroidota bacterium]